MLFKSELPFHYFKDLDVNVTLFIVNATVKYLPDIFSKYIYNGNHMDFISVFKARSQGESGWITEEFRAGLREIPKRW